MTADAALAWIGWVYVLVNSGRVLSYLPQIAAVSRCTDGARSLSLLTWSYWSLSHFTAALYAGLVVADWKLLLISASNLACCLAVVAMAARKRRQAADAPRTSVAAA